MKDIKDINILVAGDIMLDKYLCGDVERISPEAPVPVVKITKEYSTLGGCGNVVRNLREIGVQVTCISAIGNDEAGSIVLKELTNLNVDKKLIVTEKVTTQKTRIIANMSNTQMLRIDEEDIKYVNSDSVKIDGTYDIIIVSDYNKGMITSGLMYELRALNVPIIVDPKPENMWMYNDVFMITPNKKEYDSMCLSTNHLFSQNIRYILKTLGKDGMEIQEFGKSNISIPAIPIDVYDVTGAGDVVISIVAVCIAKGLEVSVAIKIANKCAGLAVTQSGTSLVDKNLFLGLIDKL